MEVLSKLCQLCWIQEHPAVGDSNSKQPLNWRGLCGSGIFCLEPCWSGWHSTAGDAAGHLRLLSCPRRAQSSWGLM